MTVEKLIEFLQTIPKDAIVVKLIPGTSKYREVAFDYFQTINANGSIAKRVEVRQQFTGNIKQ